jgi:hypothetical protein
MAIRQPERQNVGICQACQEITESETGKDVEDWLAAFHHQDAEVLAGFFERFRVATTFLQCSQDVTMYENDAEPTGSRGGEGVEELEIRRYQQATGGSRSHSEVAMATS